MQFAAGNPSQIHLIGILRVNAIPARHKTALHSHSLKRFSWLRHTLIEKTAASPDLPMNARHEQLNALQCDCASEAWVVIPSIFVHII
jgi:hypothetical protein